MTAQDSRVSRRTIAKGAAWAVPAITLTSAPLVAASGEVWIDSTESACKLPGASCVKELNAEKGYALRVQVCSSVESDVTIHFDPATINLNGTSTSGWVIQPDPLIIENILVGANDCESIILALDGNPDSSNADIDGSISFSWSAANGRTGTGSFAFSAPSTPPCDHCAPPA